MADFADREKGRTGGEERDDGGSERDHRRSQCSQRKWSATSEAETASPTSPLLSRLSRTNRKARSIPRSTATRTPAARPSGARRRMSYDLQIVDYRSPRPAFCATTGCLRCTTMVLCVMRSSSSRAMITTVELPGFNCRSAEKSSWVGPATFCVWPGFFAVRKNTLR